MASADAAWIDAPCPACGSAACRPWGVGRGAGLLHDQRFAVVTCVQCGLVYDRPRWQALEPLYQSAYRGEHGERFHGLAEAIIWWLEDRRAHQVAGLRAPGAALDIGCGRGIFLARLQRRGWRVVGTELSRAVAASSAHRQGVGVRIVHGELDALSFAEAPFDLITLWHVLEHVREPRLTLRRIRRLLRPDGLVIIGVPNLASWQARCFRARWLHLNLPYHLTHFTVETLRGMLEAEGLRVARVQHLHWLWVQNVCGWLQGLLDAVCPTPQLLLHSVERTFAGWWRALPAGRRVIVAMELAVSYALTPVLLPLCVVLMCAESAAGCGGTIQVIAHPQAGDA